MTTKKKRKYHPRRTFSRAPIALRAHGVLTLERANGRPDVLAHAELSIALPEGPDARRMLDG